MKREYRWLLLGIIAVSLGIIVAIFFPPGRELKTPKISGNPPLPTSGLPVIEKTFTQTQTGQSALIQQMERSGQLDPPPGNTDKMHSIAAPFVHSTQAAPLGISLNTDGNGQGQQMFQQGNILISAQQMNKMAATATVSQLSPAASNQAQAPQVPIPAQVPNQPIEFESPPGIGSPIGGR